MPFVLLPTILLACQEPFDVTRKDLGPFRIAALGVHEGVASAALWSGLGLYHDEAPLLTWTLNGQELGQGWDLVVPEPGQLDLSVLTPEGDTLLASVSVAEGPALPSVTRSEVALGEDLSLDTRASLPETPVDLSAAEGMAQRLRLDSAGDLNARWMSAAGLGTLLELDPQTADVLAEELAWDDDAVLVSRSDSGPGLYPQLVLLLDGQGGNTWLWADAAIGVDTPLLRHEGRLLQADALVPAGWVSAVLQSDDSLQGMHLTQVLALDSPDLELQTPLTCAPQGQPFRMAWLTEGRCTRDELNGASVVLETW